MPGATNQQSEITSNALSDKLREKIRDFYRDEYEDAMSKKKFLQPVLTFGLVFVFLGGMAVFGLGFSPLAGLVVASAVKKACLAGMFLCVFLEMLDQSRVEKLARKALNSDIDSGDLVDRYDAERIPQRLALLCKESMEMRNFLSTKEKFRATAAPAAPATTVAVPVAAPSAPDAPTV